MKVYYFDLGLYNATELKWITEDIFPELNITNYHAYGFEPCKKSYESINQYFKNNNKITILNKAISNNSETKKLYYSMESDEGHSLYSSKFNVSEKNYEYVECIKFSEFLYSLKDINKTFNIVRLNIEGAEWDLFNDLINAGLKDNINIFCGAGDDVKKIEEYKSRINEYYHLLSKNNINIYQFCAIYRNSKENIKNMIKKSLKL